VTPTSSGTRATKTKAAVPSRAVTSVERHTPQPPPPPARLPRPLSARGTVSSRLRLAALPTAASIGRHYTAVQLRMWNLDALAEDCSLVTSELIANAVAATRGCRSPHSVPTIVLRLRFTPARLFCEIRDDSLDPPLPADPVELCDYSETGRGLMLVAGCSDDWGYYYYSTFSRTGKIVWAAFDVVPVTR
jgi:anti-sigma regulatory factor (Ser/Thr protein kinase)